MIKPSAIKKAKNLKKGLLFCGINSSWNSSVSGRDIDYFVDWIRRLMSKWAAVMVRAPEETASTPFMV